MKTYPELVIERGKWRNVMKQLGVYETAKLMCTFEYPLYLTLWMLVDPIR